MQKPLFYIEFIGLNLMAVTRLGWLKIAIRNTLIAAELSHTVLPYYVTCSHITIAKTLLEMPKPQL